MAGPSTSGGSGEHSLDWGDAAPAIRDAMQLYFRKDEAKTLVMKVTAINHSLDYLKIGLAAVATGLTLVKVDFTLFKVDEKGISWLGGTLHQFPWANEGHNWWRKIMPEKVVRKFDKKDEDKKEEERELRDYIKETSRAASQELRSYVDQTFYKDSHAKGLHTGIRRAQDAADRANHEVDELRTKLRNAGSAGTPSSKAPRDNAKKLNELRSSVTSLSQALAGI